jgi:hypothetical protein
MNNTRFNKYAFTLAHLGIKGILQIILSRMCSVNKYYVLHKNIDSPVQIIKIRKNVSVVTVDDDDFDTLVQSVKTLDVKMKRELVGRLIFYRSGLKNCYAAKTKEGEIAYIQWIIFPSENEILREQYSSLFYPLKQGQVMIENVFTFPKFRGIGLLPHVMGLLINKASEAGYKIAVTYIRADRISSLNEAIIMGFKITKMVTEYKILGFTKRFL